MVYHLPHRAGGDAARECLKLASAPDTIAAVATAPGRGGIGIVRVSGPLASRIAVAIVGAPLAPRRAAPRAFASADGEALDYGVAIFCPAPRSFTGEDVLELQGHGGPLVLDMVLERALSLGARRANPGEFTQRAFINGKLDLAQAEAVADLIDSATRQSAKGAARSLAGAFSNRVGEIDRNVLALRTHCEAAIDFPDEDVDFLLDADVASRLSGLRAQIRILLRQARQGALLKDGLNVAIAGRPNVGKSSLFNKLSGEDRAIVTSVPGTTRDTLTVDLDLDGLLVRLVDTAGLREAEDAIEAEGVLRAERAIAAADAVVRVFDDRIAASPQPARGEIVARNKADLSGRPAGRLAPRVVRISARSGAGLEAFLGELKAAAGYRVGEGAFTARRRHVEALEAADRALEAAAERLAEGSAELLAEELRGVHGQLGSIVGETSSDALLGEIFASFCIGK